jgi:hypothetical protein
MHLYTVDTSQRIAQIDAKRAFFVKRRAHLTNWGLSFYNAFNRITQTVDVEIKAGDALTESRDGENPVVRNPSNGPRRAW